MAFVCQEIKGLLTYLLTYLLILPMAHIILQSFAPEIRTGKTCPISQAEQRPRAECITKSWFCAALEILPISLP